jgi:predicted transcriptional regulator
MRTTPYTIRLYEALKRELEREAALDERLPAQLAVRAIRAMIQARQAKRAAIGAALAEAEEGRFISEDAMMAWVETWGHGVRGSGTRARHSSRPQVRVVFLAGAARDLQWLRYCYRSVFPEGSPKARSQFRAAIPLRRPLRRSGRDMARGARVLDPASAF